MTTACRPPATLVAGDSFEFRFPVPSDYSGWVGHARLQGPADAAAVDATVTTDGSDFVVAFGTDTDELAPGRYTVSVWATTTGKRRTLASYALTVTGDIDGGDIPAQSHAQKMLSIIEAALEARISGNGDGGIESYSVDGTTVNKIPTDRLEALHKKYAAMVARESSNGTIGSVQMVVPAAAGGLGNWWNVR